MSNIKSDKGGTTIKDAFNSLQNDDNKKQSLMDADFDEVVVDSFLELQSFEYQISSEKSLAI